MKTRLLFLSTFLLVLFGLQIASAQGDPTVYVTKTGSKYHSAGCSYLRKSAIPMKLSEAVSRYSPCSRCNPPVITDESKNSLDKKSLKSNQEKLKSTDTRKGSATEKGIDTTPTGKTIYEGPRGGRYHYSKSGKKVYEKKRR